MSEKDTTASSLPEASDPDTAVETTEEALESRGQLGRDYLWNTAASLMSSLAVVIMGVAIMRSGATDTFARAQYGLFTLALAIGQQYQTVGLYEVRTFHVTDVRRRFNFGTYLSTRLLTCLVMVGLIAYHSWTASTKDPYPAFTVIAAMALLRIFDAFEDVYYSEFQRSGRLDIAGKACFARIFTTTFLWSGLYWVTQDLLLSTLVTFAVTCLVLVVAYGLPARGLFPLLPSFNLRGIGGILWECLPLFIAAFLNQYLANALGPRRRTARRLRDHLHAGGRDQHALPVRLPPAADPHGAALDRRQAHRIFRHRAPRPRHDRGRIRARRRRHLLYRRSPADPRVQHGRIRLRARTDGARPRRRPQRGRRHPLLRAGNHAPSA